MKTNKFRSWNAVDECSYYFQNGNYFDKKNKEIDKRCFDWRNAEQFTGLFDKNVKEIYEGDILLDPRYEEHFRVEYRPNLAGYVGFGDDVACGCYDINIDGIEIIGNIHENPELIK